MQLLRTAVRSAAEAALSKKGRELAKIVLAWNDLLPSAYASRCWPHKMQSCRLSGEIRNLLQVHAEDAGTGLELTYYCPTLIEKMTLYFGRRLVDKVLVKTVGVKGRDL